MQTSVIDLIIIAVYLIGITLFGCSFYFKKGGKDARTFTTGGGRIPNWAIALSIFATQVSSISFLALPAKAYLTNWNCFVLTLTIPIAAFVAAKWFVPFYRKSTSVSAYTFLEERFGPWARIWADAIQSLILLLGTVAVIVSLCCNIPGGLGHGFQMAWDAGKFSLGSFSLKEWGIETFWVSFLYGVCINLQNYGIDQSFTQRYIAAKDDKSAARSAFSGAMMYIPGTFLFVMVGTLIWMFSATHPGLIPAEVAVQSDAVFPWYIVNRLPHGISGLLVAAIIAAAMSTVAATLNSGSTVLLEDYYKRFFPAKAAAAGRNIRFLRSMTVVLTVASICVAVAVMNVKSALTAWWGMQSVLSGGMLGLFLLGAYSRRTTSTQAVIATLLGVLAVIYITFGQKILPLPGFIHLNLSIVLGTLTLFFTGWLLATLKRQKTV